MHNNHLKQSFNSITPTDLQKKRMLENILEKNQQQPTSRNIIFNSHRTKPFVAIAASFIIVILGSVTLQHMNEAPPSTNPNIPASPPMTQNLINYNNACYRLTQELTNFVPEDLMGPLSEIETLEGITDTIWELRGHDPLRIIVVEHLGKYYICENLDLPLTDEINTP